MNTALTPAGRRILDAASELFYNEGIHAVGVEAVARKAGVTKKTLYDRFGSKDELIAAYLETRDRRWRAWLTAYLDRRGEDAAGRLLATFDALAEWARAYNPRGCAFINALSELPDPEHPGRAVIHAEKRWMLHRFSALAAETGAADPQALAQTLFILYEGALASLGVDVVDDPITRAKSVAAMALTEMSVTSADEFTAQTNEHIAD